MELADPGTLDAEALAGALRAGTIDDLLFPDHPETRLPQLLPAIERFFPPQAGSDVAGPMRLLRMVKPVAAPPASRRISKTEKGRRSSGVPKVPGRSMTN